MRICHFLKRRARASGRHDVPARLWYTYFKRKDLNHE